MRIWAVLVAALALWPVRAAGDDTVPAPRAVALAALAKAKVPAPRLFYFGYWAAVRATPSIDAGRSRMGIRLGRSVTCGIASTRGPGTSSGRYACAIITSASVPSTVANTW